MLQMSEATGSEEQRLEATAGCAERALSGPAGPVSPSLRPRCLTAGRGAGVLSLPSLPGGCGHGSSAKC